VQASKIKEMLVKISMAVSEAQSKGWKYDLDRCKECTVDHHWGHHQIFSAWLHIPNVWKEAY